MKRESFVINRELLIQIFFFIAFGLLLLQLFLVAQPFLPGLLGAVILALGFYPAYVKVRNRINNPNLAALLLTLSVVLVFVLPLVIMVIFVLREAERLLPTVQQISDIFKSGDYGSIKERLPLGVQSAIESYSDQLADLGLNLKPVILNNVRALGAKIISMGSFTARSLFFAVFNLFVLLIAIFFAFRDGEALLRWALSLVPMKEAHKQVVAKRAYETFRAVAVGVFLTAATQGFVAMIGYWIAGVRLPVLLGFGTAIASCLGGSVLVTVPVAFLYMGQDKFWGFFLLFWGVLVVGLLDNFLRPYLIGNRARMPFILIFFGIVGGLKAYGFLGIILGPILIATILTFVKIYRETYNDE